jgi:hypothetical protein
MYRSVKAFLPFLRASLRQRTGERARMLFAGYFQLRPVESSSTIVPGAVFKLCIEARQLSLALPIPSPAIFEKSPDRLQFGDSLFKLTICC